MSDGERTGSHRLAEGLARPAGAHKFVAEESLPALSADAIKDSLERLTVGPRAYQAAATLSRARHSEVALILQATASPSADERWALLWAATPLLARAARNVSAQPEMARQLCRDMSALIILSKFTAKKSRAALQVFSRLGALLSETLAPVRAREPNGSRRAEILDAISENIARASDQAGRGGRLSPEALRERLTTLKSKDDAPADEEAAS